MRCFDSRVCTVCRVTFSGDEELVCLVYPGLTSDGTTVYPPVDQGVQEFVTTQYSSRECRVCNKTRIINVNRATWFGSSKSYCLSSEVVGEL